MGGCFELLEGVDLDFGVCGNLFELLRLIGLKLLELLHRKLRVGIRLTVLGLKQTLLGFA